ncbi:AAA family ATPase, partial [Streptomyces sp. NPDC059491]|uniref:AAA family ATPase n=1 Tax=Streptomyces sp. NPDC059491 TaxID=3346850 RepID=UPI003698FA69
MARQGGRPTRQGFGLFEREAALTAAEDALDLLTGLADDPPWPDHAPVPAPRGARGPHLVAVPDTPAADHGDPSAETPGDERPRPDGHLPTTVAGPRDGTGADTVRHPADLTPDRPRAARRGGILAYAAPAGLGKTTLLAEIRRRAAARGCTVLSARGGDQEQRVAFHVARQLLQPQLAHATDTELRERLGSWYDIVGPALGLRAAAEGSPPDPQGLRDGLDWVLTHLAVRRDPLVVVLDDAHWADPESLGWLAAFAPRAEELPMLLVVGY